MSGPEPGPLRIRRAWQEDRDRVDGILAAAGMGALARSHPLANILVAERGGRLVGAVALEVEGLAGLVAGLAVDAAETDAERIRAELMHGLIARALELSLRRLYAVADGREDLFRSFGFEVVEAERVPSALRRRAAEVFAARPEGGAASPVLMERPLA